MIKRKKWWNQTKKSRCAYNKVLIACREKNLARVFSFEEHYAGTINNRRIVLHCSLKHIEGLQYILEYELLSGWLISLFLYFFVYLFNFRNSKNS